MCAWLWDASLMSLIVKYCELGAVLHIPGKKGSQLRNCLHQTGLWACLWAFFFYSFILFIFMYEYTVAV